MGMPRADCLIDLPQALISFGVYPLEGDREKCGTDFVLGGRFAKKAIRSPVPC